MLKIGIADSKIEQFISGGSKKYWTYTRSEKNVHENLGEIHISKGSTRRADSGPSLLDAYRRYT